MDVSLAVMLVANRFQYKKDSNFLLDSWSVMKDRNGVFYGDCEDFSLTVFWYLSDRNLLKFLFNLFFGKYKLIWCKTLDGQYHFYGKVNGLCFDNYTRRTLPEDAFLKETGHEKIMGMLMILCIPQLIKGWLKR